MSTATTGVPAAPWAPDLAVVRKALSLRTNRVALTRIEKSEDGREWGSARAFLLPSELDEAVAWVADNAGPRVTLTWTIGFLTPEGAERINTSPTQTVARAGDMAGWQWVASDLDPSEDTPLSVYLSRLTEFGMKPSLLNDSGRGLHAYWQLPESVHHTQAGQAAADLVRYFQSDPGTTEPNRNLRLPGTWNGKPEARRLAVVKAFTWEPTHSLDALSERACELSPRPAPPPKRTPRPVAPGDGWPDGYRAQFDLADELTRVSSKAPVGQSVRKWLCPCGEHEGTLPQVVIHRDNDQRAVCFGTSHPEGMGRKTNGGTRTAFDVIDLHAWEAGQTVEDYMRDQRARWKGSAGTPPQGGEQAEQSSESAQSRPTEQGQEQGSEQANAAQWPEPFPLSVNPPSVPTEGLPEFLGGMVRAVANTMQTPVEVPLTFALTTLSAATRGVWEVQVSPSWSAGPTCLYAVTLADSGERKSGGEKPLRRALDEAEKRVAVAVKAENREREVRRKAAEARMKAVPEDEDGVLREQAVVHENRPRPVPELILSDTTTEALGIHQQQQGGATSLFMTEAQAFRTVAGAYADKGKGGNVALLNHSYDADPYRDKRVGRPGVSIPRPVLSWGAAVQPQVLAGYADGTTEGSGFLARFALFLPASLVGGRQMRTDPIPPDVQARWDDALTVLHTTAWAHYAKMTDDPDEFGEPLVITCTDDAADLLLDYAQDLEDRKGTDHALRDLGSWIEKHPARLARIAALFALVENPYASTIGAAHMSQALTLAAPLIQHATATLRVLRNTGESGPVRRTLDALAEMKQATVSTRDVHQRLRSQKWAERSEDVKTVLLQLAEWDYLSGPEQVSGPKGGRPTEQWTLSPRAFPDLPPDGGRAAGTPAQDGAEQ